MFSLFKANKVNSGSMAVFNAAVDSGNGQNAGKKDDLMVWLSARRQKTWDEQSKRGSFYGKEDQANSINTKLNLSEMGGIRQAILNRTSFSAYHSNPNGSVQISLSYSKKQNEQTQRVYEGFYLNITRNQNDKFNVPMSLDEGQALADYLLISQFVFYNARLSNFLKQERQGGNSGSSPASQYQQPRGNSSPNNNTNNVVDEDPFASTSDDDPFATA